MRWGAIGRERLREVCHFPPNHGLDGGRHIRIPADRIFANPLTDRFCRYPFWSEPIPSLFNRPFNGHLLESSHFLPYYNQTRLPEMIYCCFINFIIFLMFSRKELSPKSKENSFFIAQCFPGRLFPFDRTVTPYPLRMPHEEPGGKRQRRASWCKLLETTQECRHITHQWMVGGWPRPWLECGVSQNEQR